MRESKPLAPDERVCEVPPKMGESHVRAIDIAAQMELAEGERTGDYELLAEIHRLVRALSSGSHVLISVNEISEARNRDDGAVSLLRNGGNSILGATAENLLENLAAFDRWLSTDTPLPEQTKEGKSNG